MSLLPLLATLYFSGAQTSGIIMPKIRTYAVSKFEPQRKRR